MSGTKSMFLNNGLEGSILDQIKNIFPFEVQDLENGFKYLGHFLKPNNYLKEDRWWILRKVQKGIGHWCNKWLSLGVRFILVKYFLENILVY